MDISKKDWNYFEKNYQAGSKKIEQTDQEKACKGK